MKVEKHELTEQEMKEMKQQLSDEELEGVSGGVILEGFTYTFTEEDIEILAEHLGNEWRRKLRPGTRYSRFTSEMRELFNPICNVYGKTCNPYDELAQWGIKFEKSAMGD